jgi:NAD(P)-dependent dehydrogenase (short-subunit alcohol dehydrogenase family)
MSQGLLTGKVADVTGAGGGIGRAHALLLAAEGAAVVVNDVGGARDGVGAGTRMADEVVAEITAKGGRAVASYDSVATREGADGIVWTALSKLGRLDILVNNAGILRDRTLLNLSEAEWDVVQSVHLRGTFLCTQAAARVMKQLGQGGRIVNTTSVSGLTGNFGQANYAAAKAGIAGFTFTAAKELERFGITVNAIAPVALTRMTEDLPMAQGMTADDLGPQYIAPVALYFASDLAKNVTGRILGVQGPRVFEWKVTQTDGVTLPERTPWTARAIAEKLAAIGE